MSTPIAIYGLRYKPEELMKKLFVRASVPNPKYKPPKPPCNHYTLKQIKEQEFVFCPKCGLKLEIKETQKLLHGVKMVGTDTFYLSMPKLSELVDINGYQIMNLPSGYCYIVLNFTIMGGSFDINDETFVDNMEVLGLYDDDKLKVFLEEK